ncbi:MAG: CARDB domain-containing protein, partial [Candidatus Bipolaricaulia bacterium]
MTISGLTIDAFASVTVNGTLTLQGNLTGAGDLNVNGTLNWSSGTMSGSGTTTIAATGTMNISDLPVTLLGRTITNAGTVIWSSTVNIKSGRGAVLNNLASGLFDVQNDQVFFFNQKGIISQFNNAGTFRKSAGTGFTDIDIVFNNSGTVDVNSGTLNLKNGGTSSGAFSVAAGATLDFIGGNHSLDTSSSVTGAGTVDFSKSTVTISGTYNLAGTTSVTGGTVSFTGSVVNVGSTLTIDSGMADFSNIEGAITTTTLNLSVGTLTGSSNVTVTGLTTWSSGTMSGSGTTTIAATGTMNISDLPVTLLGRTITNAGTVIWSSTVNIKSGRGAVLNNLASGLFDVQNDQVFFFNQKGIISQFNNAGTFRKSAGTGFTDIDIVFNNSGTVDVNSGTLNLTTVTQHVGNTLADGTWNVFANATLNITTGVDITTNNANVALSGVGSNFAKINSLATNGGSFSILDGRDFTTVGALSNADNVTIGDGSTFTVTSDYTQISGNTTLNNGTLAASTVVDIQGGNLSGSGTVDAPVVNNAGQANSGGSPGIINIMGNYMQSANGTLNIEIGGLPAGTEFDKFIINGTATLDGTLNVSLINGFVPIAGDRFQVMTFGSRSGDFATQYGLDLGSGLAFDPVFDTGSLTLVTTATAAANLAVTKSASPDPVAVESDLTYTVTVTNNGPDDATGVVLTDTLPAGVTFESVTPSPECSEAGGTVTCDLGTLANGTSATVKIVVAPTAVGKIVNTATVSANETDPDDTNNSASADTTVNLAEADLAVTETDTPDLVMVGGDLTYTVTVTNNGPSDATGGTLTHTLPGSVTLVSVMPSSPTCTQAGGTVICNLGTLANGTSATVTIVVTPTAAGEISNTASVEATESDPDSANNTATENTTAQTPQAAIHDLIDQVEDLKLDHRTEKKLTKRLGKAIKKLDKGKEYSAVKQLNKFIREVGKRRGKKISDKEAADALIKAAQGIITAITGPTPQDAIDAIR